MNNAKIDFSRESISSLLANAQGSLLQLDVDGVGPFIGHFANRTGSPPNSHWVVDGEYLCSRTNQIVPIALIREIAIFSEEREIAARYRFDEMMKLLDCAHRTSPLFLQSEFESQLHSSGQRLRFALQRNLPKDLMARYNYPYIDTRDYSQYGIQALSKGFSDGIRMSVPLKVGGEITVAEPLYHPVLYGENFFQTPPKFSGPVRLYADLDYLRQTVEIEKITGGGISIPLVGGGFSFSRAAVLGLQRVYDVIERYSFQDLSNLGDTMDEDCKLVGYISFPPTVREEKGRIIIILGEPAWKPETCKLDGKEYVIGVFHVRNVKTKDELKQSDWMHILMSPDNAKVTLDSLFSNSEPLIIYATHKNEFLESRFGKSKSYLVLRYAEYKPGVMVDGSFRQ